VVWRETVRDEFGLPVPKNPDNPDGPKLSRAQQETYSSRDEAEARRDELNAAKHTTGTATLAAQRKAGDLPFGHNARAWLDSQRVKRPAATRSKLPRTFTATTSREQDGAAAK
jgi:integrase